MAKFKSTDFQKGWYFHNPSLLGVDGFNDVNNFVLYKHGIEKVKGWKLLVLIPAGSPADTFGRVIDDFDNLIDTFT